MDFERFYYPKQRFWLLLSHRGARESVFVWHFQPQGEKNKTTTAWGGKKIANTHKGSAKQISTHKPICTHPTQPHPIHNESDRKLPAYLLWKMARVTIIASVCGITAGCALRLKEMGLKWVQNQNSVSLYFSPRPCWEKGTAFGIVAFTDTYILDFFSSLLQIRLHPHTSTPQVKNSKT